MPLVKTEVNEFVPGTAGVEGSPETLTCTPNPPDTDASDPPPDDDDVPTNPELQRVYLYVPNITDPDPGDTVIETRTPWFAPAPTGYVCTTGLFIDHDPSFPGGSRPVYETRCFWEYP